MVATSQAIARHGRTYTTENGYPATRPEVVQQRSALTAQRHYLGLLGLSPADRTRLSVPDRETDRDELEAFLDAKQA